MAWLSHLNRTFEVLRSAERYRNAAIGIFLVPVLEFFVVPLQMALNYQRVNLPASILVMALLAIFMLIGNYIHGGVASFYTKHLKGPADFIGRHMSFGFVTYFVMLSKDHIGSAVDIPRIAGAFAVTSLFSYAGAYLLASGSCKLERRIRRLREREEDVENGLEAVTPSALPTKRTSKGSELTLVPTNNEALVSLDALCGPTLTAELVAQSLPILFPLFLLVVVGLPVYFATNYEMPFEVFCFVFLWCGAVLFQRSLRAWQALQSRPRLRSSLVIIFNPLLVASVLGTAYFWTKTILTHRDIDDTLGSFRRYTNWAEIFVGVAKGDTVPRPGAGDLAAALLDAGIVTLGLKMFEYRLELWKSCASVVSTSLVFAIANIFLNVLLACAIGLPASEALAFAARNVTIALGIPAVNNLQGSTALMTALVVFSGMLFQMIGDLLFDLVGIRDRVVLEGVRDLSDNMAKTRIRTADVNHNKKDDHKVIAAGVSVGINAAAMGTSHLIERDSRATAYSALSMTLFGSFTVALTAVPAIAQCLTSLASR